MKSPATSITDDHLAEIERAACRSYGETTMVSKQEVASIIARLRAAEADANRWNLRAEVLRQLYNSSLSNEELDIAINAAMERKV